MKHFHFGVSYFCHLRCEPIFLVVGSSLIPTAWRMRKRYWNDCRADLPRWLIHQVARRLTHPARALSNALPTSKALLPPFSPSQLISKSRASNREGSNKIDSPTSAHWDVAHILVKDVLASFTQVTSYFFESLLFIYNYL